MIYAVIGSRDFDNYSILRRVLKKHYITQIVSGGATGADTLGARYAQENKIPLIVFKPDWINRPKTGGFFRNKEIIRSVDVVIAFWNGISRGTKDSLDHAKKLKKKVIIVNFDGTIRESVWEQNVFVM